MTIRNTVLSPLQTSFFSTFLFFLSTENKRTLSAIRQRTLTVRCSLYLFTVHVYTHKKIVHHRYYISNRHPLTSWMGQSECLKTIIYIDSACIQCSLKHTLSRSLSLSYTHTCTQTHCPLFFYTHCLSALFQTKT